jgi:two-component system osmolarity sensor histidine kinase EnvZ
VEPSRNKNTGGVGLGMTIARDTILSHGGEIKLETSPMKGLRVLITLPIKNDIAQ